jgi:hypothetical protein
MRANAVLCFVSCLCLSVGAIGCGDDGDGGKDAAVSGGTGGTGGDGGGGSGGRQVLPTPDGGGNDRDAMVTPGEGIEGEPCDTPSDCGEGLSCIDSGFGFGICARACTGDSQCGAELCLSPLTGVATDSHCNNTVREPFTEFCGALDTAVCSTALNLRCLLLGDAPIGICATLCSSGGADAGVSEDTCEGDYECVAGIVQDNGDGIDGLCGSYVERGAECGVMMGTFCADEDLCTPTDPNYMPQNGETTVFRCRQDCTDPMITCPDGTTCTPYRTIAFCLED